MYQVSSGTQVVGKIRVAVHRVQSRGSSAIAVLPNQTVNCWILSKRLYSWSEYQQFSAIGHGHSGAINGFVTQPCAMKFVRIEIHHGFGNRLIEHFDIHFSRKFGRAVKTFLVVADE